jgi:hypothetical protein
MAFYPVVMLLCVLFSSVWAGLLILGFVLLVEKNDKLSKQTIHAFLYFFAWQAYLLVTGQLMRFYGFLTGNITDLFIENLSYSAAINLTNAMSNIRGFFNGLGSLIFVAYTVMILFMGVLPLLKGKEMALPGKGLVAKIYGEVKGKTQDAPPASDGQ